MEDIHIIECIGKAIVTIKNGKVVSTESPMINSCPLAKRFALPVDKITEEKISINIENRIKTFGMFTAQREIYSDVPFVGFGASELISTAITGGIIDAAIIACDGAGTVVTANPSMVQGIGGRMSGLVKTSPIPEVIKRIQDGGGIVPDPSTAIMDPIAGITAAKKAGYKKLAITVVTAHDARAVRDTDPDALIIVVHTTGLSCEQATAFCSLADIMTSCASKQVREICGGKALIQAGKTVPVFGMTKRGKEVILERLKVLKQQIFVTTSTLPHTGDTVPDPLI